MALENDGAQEVEVTDEMLSDAEQDAEVLEEAVEAEQAEEQPEGQQEELPLAEGEAEAGQEEPTKPEEPKTAPLSALIKAERENRRLKRQLTEIAAREQIGAGIAPVAPKEPEKSPLEMWAEKNSEKLAEDPDAAPPASVLLADRRWQREQVSQQAQQAQQQSEQRVLVASLAKAKASLTADTQGDGLDFETVCSIGSAYLTDRDKAIIRAAGEEAGEEMYQRCLKRACASGTEEAELLEEALAAKAVAKPGANLPATATAKPKMKTTVQSPQPPARQQVLKRTGPPLPHEKLGLTWG